MATTMLQHRVMSVYRPSRASAASDLGRSKGREWANEAIDWLGRQTVDVAEAAEDASIGMGRYRGRGSCSRSKTWRPTQSPSRRSLIPRPIAPAFLPIWCRSPTREGHTDRRPRWLSQAPLLGFLVEDEVARSRDWRLDTTCRPATHYRRARARSYADPNPEPRTADLGAPPRR